LYYFRLDNTQLTVNLIDFPDAADLRVGEPVTYVFEVKNTGSNPLKINQVMTECDCLIPEFVSKEIIVGGSTRVEIQYIPQKNGEFSMNALLDANTAPPYTVLTMGGSVQ